MQNQEIRTIGLTHCATGSFGQIPSLHVWRLNELKRFGYDFEKTWKNVQEKIFDHLFTEVPNTFPWFEKGVLFTGNVSKAEVMKGFLDYIKYKPHCIVFIDDCLENIESVRELALEKSISYLGIQLIVSEISPVDHLFKKRAAI